MGQYGNQPDFGTKSADVTPTGDMGITGVSPDLKSAALYIGTGGTLIVTVVGDPSGSVSIFKNIPDGTFFPVIVKHVWATFDTDGAITTCADIVALY